jgi:hypothetical protein
LELGTSRKIYNKGLQESVRECGSSSPTAKELGLEILSKPTSLEDMGSGKKQEPM